MSKKFKMGGYETTEQVDEAIQDLKTNPKYEDVADRQMKMFLKTLKEEKERLKNKPSLKAGGMVKKDLPGNLNKAELKALRPGVTSKLREKVGDLLSAGMSASKIIEKLSGTSAKNPHKKETIRDKIRDLKANLPKNNKNNIVKRFKGGLMVKPKAAKRGY